MTNMKPKTYIVGDVHGCSAELRDLLSQMDLRHDTTVVFAGDLLDKGPDSAGVVRTVRELAERVKVVVVKGNHEEKHERFRRHEYRIAQEGGTNPIKKADELRLIAKELSGEDVAFLEQAVLYYKIPEHDALVVHAGIPMWVRELPDLSKRPSRRYNELLRLRAFDKRGRFLTLEDYSKLSAKEREEAFWAHRYDGRLGHVYFGHEPFMGGVGSFKHATGLDTGCCFGGSLTAIELSEQKYLTVEAQKAYAERMAFD